MKTSSLSVSSSVIREMRAQLCSARRIVVKVGTHTLTSKNGRPNKKRIESIVAQIAALREMGHEVVLVSSGAVGMGLAALGKKSRPRTLAEKQMAAAVGQARLMNFYQALFARFDIIVAQVLLTHDDFHNRSRNLNASTTLRKLLQSGVLPIVNENDVISVDEIRFGDNDVLAAHLSLVVEADLLLLLTTVNGVQDRTSRPAKRISLLEDISQLASTVATSDRGVLSSGGMASKLQAAELAQHNGIHVVIADGRKSDTLPAVCSGLDRGTLIPAQVAQLRGGRRKWLAFSRRTSGSILIDSGAARALVEGKRSLLPAGVLGVDGSFVAGDLVKLCEDKGAEVAKGLVNYSASDVERLCGCKTSEIAQRIGARQFDEIVHRDNLVVTQRTLVGGEK